MIEIILVILLLWPHLHGDSTIYPISSSDVNGTSAAAAATSSATVSKK